MILELFLEVSRHLANPPQMVFCQSQVFATTVPVAGVAGGGQGRSHDVADLPAIQVVVVTSVVDESVDGRPVFDPLGLQLVEKVLEDGFHLLRGEIAVADCKVDAGDDGDVDRLDAVRREDDDSLVVLENAQQNGNESVARGIGSGTSCLQENVGLVHQEDRLPRRGQVEELLEVLLRTGGVEPYLCNADNEKRFPRCLGNSLCRELHMGSAGKDNRGEPGTSIPSYPLLGDLFIHCISVGAPVTMRTRLLRTVEK